MISHFKAQQSPLTICKLDCDVVKTIPTPFPQYDPKLYVVTGISKNPHLGRFSQRTAAASSVRSRSPITNHPKTTKLYYRTTDQIDLDKSEKITIWEVRRVAFLESRTTCPDLVDLVSVHDVHLGSIDVAIGGLDKL